METKMLGVWMWPESIRKRGADAVFDACAGGGVTDVFFLTKGLSGTTAFLSPLSPPMDPERDLLREALDAAHARGMRLHTWFTSASDARYVKEHPASALVHLTKGPREDIVSITDGAYTDYMRSLLTDMLRRYDPDGVHLDYIRYNHLICGWSAEDQERYRAGGVDLGRVMPLMEKTFLGDAPDGEAVFNAFRAGDGDVVRLSEVRRGNVVRFASALAETVRREGKNLTLSAALMPEGSYDDLAFSDLHYGQHYADLAVLTDLLLPMSYSRAYGKDESWVRDTAVGTVRYGRTMVGLHAYEGGTGLSLSLDRRAAEAVPGVEGVCLFREGAFVWAFREGRSMTLLNPLPKAAASCRITVAGEEAVLETPVGPGEERTFDLPFSPDLVRVYDADGSELCALTAGE